MKKDFKRSDACSDAALVVKEANCWNEVGALYLRMGNFEKAENAFLIAFDLDRSEISRRSLVAFAEKMKTADGTAGSWKVLEEGERDSLVFKENGDWGVEGRDNMHNQTMEVENEPLGVARIFKRAGKGQDVIVRWPHKMHLFKFFEGRWWHQKRWQGT